MLNLFLKIQLVDLTIKSSRLKNLLFYRLELVIQFYPLYLDNLRDYHWEFFSFWCSNLKSFWGFRLFWFIMVKTGNTDSHLRNLQPSLKYSLLKSMFCESYFIDFQTLLFFLNSQFQEVLKIELDIGYLF